MKKGQTSVRGGIQDFLCPFTDLYITQGAGGSYSHRGTMANDVRGAQVGVRYPYYAPCDVICVMTYPSSGQAIWRSVNKVRCSNGKVCYVFFCTVHDDTFDARVNQVVKQGQQLGNMGTKGNATGVHCHIEHLQTNGTTYSWVQNQYGIWTFGGQETDTDDMWFMDGTNIMNMKTANWKYLKDVPVEGSTGKEIQEEHYAIRLLYDGVRIRKEPSTSAEIVGTLNIGDEREYIAKTVTNGHRWVQLVDKNWVAISNSEEQGKDLWVELIPIEDMKENQKPTEPVEPPKEFPNSVKFKGIDISVHNGDIDVKGNEFVIIRVGYGVVEDENFKKNVNKCQDLGIPFGVYLYDYAYNAEGAKQQAEFVMNQIKDLDVKLGVWFDMEDADGWKKKNNLLTKEHCTEMCDVFCSILKEHGYYVGIYASSSWFGTYIDELGYPKWIANWGADDGKCHGDFSNVAVMHQYTSKPIDKDVMYVDMEVMKSNPIDIPDEPTDIPTFPDVDTLNKLLENLSNIDVDSMNDFFESQAELNKRLLG